MSQRTQTVIIIVAGFVFFALVFWAIFSVKIELTAEDFSKEDLAPLFDAMPQGNEVHPHHFPKEFKELEGHDGIVM